MINEKAVWEVSQARDCESRLTSLLKSYLWSWSAEYIGLRYTGTGVSIMFKRSNYGLVLSVPLSSFQTPTYARVLIQRQIDLAEAERRLAQETAPLESRP